MTRDVPRSISAVAIHSRMKTLGRPSHAAVLQHFFKTEPGQYGAGDRFLGLRVPLLRKLAREYQALPRGDVTRLLKFPLHEERLIALFILVSPLTRGSGANRAAIYLCHLSRTAQ